MKTKIGMWVLASVFCTSIAGNAWADHHSWNGYHWPRDSQDNPVALRVIDSVSSEWQGEFETSIAEWNDSSVLELVVDPISEDDQRTRKRCQAVSGAIRVCNASYGYNGWLGVASINISGTHITKATAKVNDSYSMYWTEPSFEGNAPDNKLHVMCQEIGHDFGLDHTSTDGSSQGTCMDYSWDPSSILPNQGDLDMLVAIYDHADGSSAEPTKKCHPIRGCPSSASGPEVPPMGVRVHKGRNYEIWVARGRGETLWIHHVRLVPEEYR